MLIVANAIAGFFTDWWWLPAGSGMIGQIAHAVSSPSYRYILVHQQGAILTAFVSMLALTTLCFLAFGAGYLLAHWI